MNNCYINYIFDLWRNLSNYGDMVVSVKYTSKYLLNPFKPLFIEKRVHFI